MSLLTARDNSILRALFDAEPSRSNAKQINIRLPSLALYDETQFEIIRAREIAIMQHLDKATINQDTVLAVVGDLSALIRQSPDYASAYINRAQTRRLLLSVGDIFNTEHAVESGEILDDLGKAIDLAVPTIPGQAVSKHQSAVLAAGYTHRGSLLLKAADLVRNGHPLAGAGARLQMSSADEIEELASRDFAAGGSYGNTMAQELSVKTNPYAKMCGAIVKEAMRKEIEESEATSLQTTI